MKKIYVYKKYLTSLENYKDALELLASLAYYKCASSGGHFGQDHLNYKIIALQFKQKGLDDDEITMMLNLLKDL